MRMMMKIRRTYRLFSHFPAPYINVFMTVPTLFLAGGGTGPRIAVTHYMTATTPPKLMAIRFMLFEICLTLGLLYEKLQQNQISLLLSNEIDILKIQSVIFL